MFFLTFCLILMVSLARSDTDLKEGDSCSSDSFTGKCKLLTNCGVIYDQLLAGGSLETLCGYDLNNDPIVCCPSNKNYRTTTSTSQRPVRPPGSETFTKRPTNSRITLHPLMMSRNRTVGSRAAEKCYEYSLAVYQLVYPPVLRPSSKPVNTSVCALGSSPTLIVGGTKAQAKKYPHMAAVGFNNGNGGIKWGCGGTLISDRYVLTAAHCTSTSEHGPAIYVRLGEQNLESDDDGARPQDFQIIERKNHPKYTSLLSYHDIALLKLDRDVVFDAWIRPACLPVRNTNYDVAVATGWGRVKWAERYGSDDLLAVTLKMVPNSRCTNFYNNDDTLPEGISAESQLCAGEEGRDTCQGDSGGPLAIFNTQYNCMYDVVGVTSLGRVCGHVTPGVYTNVLHYLSWIENIVWS